MINKKGLSAVVTTLIIMLLVLVAVGIVWVVIRSVIEGGGGQVEAKAKCIGVDLQIVSAADCNSGATSCNVTVERNPGGGDIAGVKLIVTDGVTSLTVDGSAMDELGTVTISATGDALAGDAITAKVAALVDDGVGGTVVCDVVDEYTY